MGAFADNEDPDEMQHDAAFHHSSGSALFAKIKTTFRDRNTPLFRKFYLGPLKVQNGQSQSMLSKIENDVRI